VEIEVWEGNSYSEDLKKEWETLLEKSRFPNPFLTPLWNEIWLGHFGRSLDTRLILLREGKGNLVAMGHFFTFTDEDGREGLRLLGRADVSDYRDLVIAAGREEESWSALVAFFLQGPWEVLELNGISEFSPTGNILPSLLQSHPFRVTQEVEEVAVFLDLPPTWEEFLNRLNSKDRHELRRKMRRLERETSFEFLETENLSSLPDRVNVFLELHRKSRKGKAHFMTPEMEEYFAEIAHRFFERGWMHLPFLRVEGREIASFFSFQFKGTEYVYNSGYDPEWGRLSPGIVLAAYCIRRALERGMSVFHFLRGREDYKYRLGGREEKIYRIRAVKK